MTGTAHFRPRIAALALLALLPGARLVRAETVEPMPVPVLEVNTDGVWRAPLTHVLDWTAQSGYNPFTVPVGLEDVTSVNIGTNHALALKGDGTVVAWGIDNYGQTIVPEGLAGVVGIAAANGYSEALKSDGTVVHWGRQELSVTRFVPPAGLNGVVQIAAQNTHSLAVRNDGTVVAWGANERGQSQVPSSLGSVKTVAVAAGPLHSLALTENGTVVAWGWNGAGQCSVPQGLSNVVAIAAGYSHSIALKSDGTVVQWGSNRYGETSQPSDLINVVSIAAGWYHNLALKGDGTVVVWGEGAPVVGQAPNKLPAGVGGVVALAGGDNNSMAIIRAVHMPRDLPGSPPTLSPELRLRNPSSTATITGISFGITPVPEGRFTPTNGIGGLSPGQSLSFSMRYQATSDKDSHTRLQVSTGIRFPVLDITVSALKVKLGVVDSIGDDVSLYGRQKLVKWGGAVGVRRYVPPNLTGYGDGVDDVAGITTGGPYSAAWKNDGTPLVWGGDLQLDHHLPAGIVSMSSGVGYFLAVTSQGRVLSRGFASDSRMKVPATLANVVAVSANEHSLALRADGTVVAWGSNSLGQCSVPRGLTHVVAVSGALGASLALRADGTVVGWGRNLYDVARPPAGLTGVTAISASERHGLALKGDGSVVTWGPADPRLRANMGAVLNVPPDLANVTAIATGSNLSYALKADGSVVSWGFSSEAYRPVPQGLSSVLAIAASHEGTLVLMEGAGDFAPTPLHGSRTHHLAIRNQGSLLLDHVTTEIVGGDDDQFKVDNTVSRTVGSVDEPLAITFTARRSGPAYAFLRVYSNDLKSPFVLPLIGQGGPPEFHLTAAKAGTLGAAFTYAPLHAEAATGLMLQRLTFRNTTGVRLEGLRLNVSRLAAGISLYSSSTGIAPGTLEVLYTAPVQPGQTATFDLVYFDPYRRTAASINPVVNVTALVEAVPSPGPVDGRLIVPRSARETAAGRLLDIPTVRGKIYVVEYSDDLAATWFSAVHRLTGGSTRLPWVDRGQPETYTRPVNGLVRMYRVREL